MDSKINSMTRNSIFIAKIPNLKINVFLKARMKKYPDNQLQLKCQSIEDALLQATYLEKKN